jgi:hypothetical protein
LLSRFASYQYRCAEVKSTQAKGKSFAFAIALLICSCQWEGSGDKSLFWQDDDSSRFERVKFANEENRWDSDRKNGRTA